MGEHGSVVEMYVCNRPTCPSVCPSAWRAVFAPLVAQLSTWARLKGKVLYFDQV